MLLLENNQISASFSTKHDMCSDMYSDMCSILKETVTELELDLSIEVSKRDGIPLEEYKPSIPASTEKNATSFNALKYIKYLLDRIETSRELNSDGASEFEFSVGELAHPDISYPDFKRSLKMLESKGICTFHELEQVPAEDWHDDFLRIFVHDWPKFDEYYNEVKSSYKELSKAETKEKNSQHAPEKTTEHRIWWIWTNPFWILWRFIILIWRYKIIPILVVIVGFLVADYSVAWKNIKWIINQISSLFK